MGHKSWGGARPNKYDREFHEEPQGDRYYVIQHGNSYQVMDGEQDRMVFEDDDKLTCECECDLLNEQESKV